jgi:hypothetical protein
LNITLHDREAPPYDRHLTPVPAGARRPAQTLDKATRLRRRLLAFSLPVIAALFMAAEGLNPKGTDDPSFFHAFGYVYFVGVPVATALMAVALWRSRAVPRWLALLYFVGLEVAFQVTSLRPLVVVVLMAPFAVATVVLAVRIWRTAARPLVETA